MTEGHAPTFVRMRNVILVHGFWHGSWCWSPVTAHLAARGIPSVAIDVQGHGLNAATPKAAHRRPFAPEAFSSEPSPLAAVTATSAAHALLEQIRFIGGGEPCVVVAHSMHGVVASLAAELQPTLFEHLMYVTAFAPVGGAPAAAYISEPENDGDQLRPLFGGDFVQIGALRIDPADEGRHEQLRQALYADVDPATAQAAIGLLSTDGPIGVPGEPLTLTSGNYGSVPHSYLLCLQDMAVRPALQRRFVSEIDAVSATATKVFEIESAHSPMLSQPSTVADAIETVWRS